MTEYLRRVRHVRLHDGRDIVDVMGSDPTPDGLRYVGYDERGNRQTWFAADVAEEVDVEFDAQTTWVEERIEQQRGG